MLRELSAGHIKNSWPKNIPNPDQLMRGWGTSMISSTEFWLMDYTTNRVGLVPYCLGPSQFQGKSGSKLKKQFLECKNHSQGVEAPQAQRFLVTGPGRPQNGPRSSGRLEDGVRTVSDSASNHSDRGHVLTLIKTLRLIYKWSDKKVVCQIQLLKNRCFGIFF